MTNAKALTQILARYGVANGDISWLDDEGLLNLEGDLVDYLDERFSSLSRSDRRRVENAIDGVNTMIDRQIQRSSRR